MATRDLVFGGWLVWLTAVAAGTPAVAFGQDFRVDTEVFLGQEKQPALETLTIFTAGTVFDFVLTEPREVAVLDSQRGRFTLLDEARRIQARVSTQDLLEFVHNLETEALKRKEPLLLRK